jgi:hypothetical protein
VGKFTSYKRNNYQENTKLRYGVVMVCAVEFGPKIKAKSLLAGGNSDPLSKHQRPIRDVSKGQFKDVLFYKGSSKKMQNELTIQENSGSDHFFTVFSNKVMKFHLKNKIY